MDHDDNTRKSFNKFLFNRPDDDAKYRMLYKCFIQVSGSSQKDLILIIIEGFGKT